MTRPSVVLFDLGNVLVSIHPGAFVQRLGIDLPTAHQKYQKKIIEFVRQYETGHIATREYLDSLFFLFEEHYSREVLTEAMIKIIGKPIKGMEGLVRRVSTRQDVALVSNTNELHFEFCRKHFAVLRLIPRHFLSYEVGTLKPAPEYYRHVLKELAVPPSSVVLIDDLTENIEGARESGMIGIQFSTPICLEEDLRTAGVL